MKEGEAFVPEVLFEGKYYPICGHYFWDNDLGAGSVCKSLGFTGGNDIHATSRTGHVYDTNAMPVGGCMDGEDLTKCTGGDNAWGNFDFRDGRCKRGNSVGVKVTCYTQGAFVRMHMYIFLYVCTFIHVWLYMYLFTCVHGGLGLCQQGKIYTEHVSCPQDTIKEDRCFVPQDKAFSICSRLPDCKYVATTTNAGWNIGNKNSAQLGKGVLTDNAEWASCTPTGSSEAGTRSPTFIHVKYVYGYRCILSY